jgi:YidC/Oxa1 family membrane protein insertase
MDKRSIIALVLIALVIVAGPLLMPRTPNKPGLTDSTALRDSAGRGDTVAAKPAGLSPLTKSAAPSVPIAVRESAGVPAETLAVNAPDRVARFVNTGAAPLDIALAGFPDLKRRSGTLSITATRGRLLHYRIVTGADTIALDTVSFVAKHSANAVEFVSSSPDVRVNYELTPQNYLAHASIRAANVAPDAKLLIDLAQDLRSGEADTTEDLRHLAYGFRQVHGDAESVLLQKLDTTKTVAEPGPLDWVAIRNKYFAFVLMARDTTKGFSELIMRGGHRRADGFPTGVATAVMPLSAGGASFDVFTGPQSWTALRAAGHDLININPYAGWSWLRPVVQPFATIVMRLLLGLKAALGLGYGWVLVIFGISIRLLLWPLNQSAMRTSIKMQRLQPELAVVQKKYAKDPEGQRAAMMKLYQSHGMSPFSPLMGCLPMLLPMPILFALYFVFQNTIEFRGVHFLWLPDISLRDPYYITPVVMGASMLVLSWIGMRAAPQNPQAKVMGYMMPAMFTMMFMNLASGLNLYYAVQNLVAIPQQWFLTRERAKANVSPPASKAVAPLKAPR